MGNKKIVGIEIKTLSNFIKRKIESIDKIKYLDKLTGTHGWIIKYLYENRDKDIFQKDIENKLQIRRSTATVMLQLMEKNDLIFREPVSYDARLKKIVLTEKSIEMHLIIEEELGNLENQIIKGLSEEELAKFFEILEKMKKNVE